MNQVAILKPLPGRFVNIPIRTRSPKPGYESECLHVLFEERFNVKSLAAIAPDRSHYWVAAGRLLPSVTFQLLETTVCTLQPM